MKKIAVLTSDIAITSFSIFFTLAFVTDYSFILKKPISNISGLTGVFLALLLIRLLLDRESFGQLPIFRMFRKFSRLNDHTIILILVLILTSVLTAVSIARHFSFSSRALDMGLFDQAIWNTLHGDILFCSIRGNLNLLGDHFEPILFLLVPFYAIFPSVKTLVFAQAAILGFSLLPIYLIAKTKLKSRLLIFSMLISFMLAKAVRGIAYSDFHPEAFMVPLSLFAFYFLNKNKLFYFFLFVLGILFCKETAVFIIAGFGVYSFFKLKKRVLGIGLILAGIGAFTYETRIFIPQFNYLKSYFYGVRLPFGATYTDNLLFVAKNPFKFTQFLLRPEKIEFCFKLLGEVGWLSLFSPASCLLILLPLITIILGSDALSGYYQLSSHYVGHILPFVYIAAIYGVANLSNILHKRKSIGLLKSQFMLGIYIIAVALFFYGKTDAYKFRKFMDGAKANRSREKLTYLARLPKNASVAATANLVPQISHRKFIYDLGINNEPTFNPKTEYVVIDFDFSPSDPTKKQQVLKECLKNGYSLVFNNSNQTFFIFNNPNINLKELDLFRGNLGI